MMKYLLISLLGLLAIQSMGQTIWTTGSGRWVEPSIWWSGAVPDSNTTVIINGAHSDTIDSIAVCNTLFLYGDLVIKNAGSLYVAGACFIDGGTLDIDSGKVRVEGYLSIEGEMDIEDGPSAYVELTNSIGNATSGNMQVLDGAVRIYSGSMSFPMPEYEEEEEEGGGEIIIPE